jgi:hypothetical protein
MSKKLCIKNKHNLLAVLKWVQDDIENPEDYLRFMDYHLDTLEKELKELREFIAENNIIHGYRLIQMICKEEIKNNTLIKNSEGRIFCFQDAFGEEDFTWNPLQQFKNVDVEGNIEDGCLADFYNSTNDFMQEKFYIIIKEK